MKLYSLPLSPYASRVRGAIYGKQLPVEIVTPPADWRNSEAFRALNPLMRIPVLELDDGSGLPESSIIVEYLEDKFPTPALRPASAEGLSRVRLITQIADLYVMQAMMPLFYLFDSKERDMAAIEAQLSKLDQGLMQLESMLKRDDYAYGGKLSTADVWLTPVRFSLEGLMSFSGRSRLLDRHKAIAAYADVARRDASLGRVWQEMEQGLRDFRTSRADSRPSDQS
jgi:glutathione S-transferase